MGTKNTMVVFTTSNENLYDKKFFEPIGPNNEILLDYNLFNAIEAGFNKIILVVAENMKEFLQRETVEKFKNKVEVLCVSRKRQSHFSLSKRIDYHAFSPNAYALWKTKKYLNGPFLVIDGRFYHGKNLYRNALKFMNKAKEESAVINYPLKNTLSSFGGVDRCVCVLNEKSNLIKQLFEIKNIRKVNANISCEDNDMVQLSEDTLATTGVYILNEKYFLAYHELLKSRTEEDKKITIPALINFAIQKTIVKAKALNISCNWFSISYKPERVLAISKILELIKRNEHPKVLYHQKVRSFHLRAMGLKSFKQIIASGANS